MSLDDLNTSVTRLFAVRDSLPLDDLCKCRRKQVCIIRFVVLTCNCQQIHSRLIQSYRTKDSNKMVTRTAAHCGWLHTRSPSSKHTNHSNLAYTAVSKHCFLMCEYSISGHQVEIFLLKTPHCLDMMNLTLLKAICSRQCAKYTQSNARFNKNSQFMWAIIIIIIKYMYFPRGFLQLDTFFDIKKNLFFFFKNQCRWFSVRSVGMGRWEWDS